MNARVGWWLFAVSIACAALVGLIVSTPLQRVRQSCRHLGATAATITVDEVIAYDLWNPVHVRTR